MEGFREGCFQVQDESSMCVARLVNQKAKSIIDVCSAPGGKVTHLAELKEDQASIIACDVSQKKVQKIDDNCKRLALHSIQPKWQMQASIMKLGKILLIVFSGCALFRIRDFTNETGY